MSELSHIYVHLASVGEAGDCAVVRDDLRPVLNAMYERGEIRGYRLFELSNRKEAEDELLHHMFDYESATNGRFPIVYAAVTPPLKSDGKPIDELMGERGFRRFC